METKETNAKQGRTGTPVLKVLIFALILTAIAAVGLGFFAVEEADTTVGEAPATQTQ